MTISNYIQGLDSDASVFRKGCIFDAIYDNQEEKIAETKRLFSERDEVELWIADFADTSTPDAEPKKLRRGHLSSVGQLTPPPKENSTLRRCLIQDALTDDRFLCV